jgi:hypothetical protein
MTDWQAIESLDIHVFSHPELVVTVEMKDGTS